MEFLPNRRKKAGNLFRFPVRCAAVLAAVISLRLGSDRNVHSVAVFTLRVFGELPFEKIAALFNKSPGWARVVFYRAKVQIKEYMEALESEQNIL